MAVLLLACSALAQEHRLESLYIVREGVSDATPHWFDYVLAIEPDSVGSRVRWVRVAPATA